MDQVSSVSLLLILMLLLLPMIAKALTRHPKRLMAIKNCILALYLLINLYLTLLSRTVANEYSMMLTPFWSYISAFKGDTHLGVQIVLNILFFVPFGFLMRFTFEGVKVWQVIAVGILFSALIETAQLIFKLGMFEWDDMINNTLGTVIGVVSYWGMGKMKSKLIIGKLRSGKRME